MTHLLSLLTSSIFESSLEQYRLFFLGKHLKKHLIETTFENVIITTQSIPLLLVGKISTLIYTEK